FGMGPHCPSGRAQGSPAKHALQPVDQPAAARTLWQSPQALALAAESCRSIAIPHPAQEPCTAGRLTSTQRRDSTMGKLRVMSRRGDDQVAWDMRQVAQGDPEALAAVQEAERIFREQRERGATAFRVEKPRVLVRMDEFDPAAEQIMMVPRLVGGA